jgi:malate dehydrogenase (oxaloacetate-decarboxylating)
VFRGLLDARAAASSMSSVMTCERALASVVTDAELNPAYIIPSVFHPDVAATVATAVAQAAGAGSPHPDTGAVAVVPVPGI